MYYLRKRRTGRAAAQNKKRRFKGPLMTFFSLAVIGGFIAASKARNPDADIKSVIMMFGAVVVACVLMTVLSAKKNNDD